MYLSWNESWLCFCNVFHLTVTSFMPQIVQSMKHNDGLPTLKIEGADNCYFIVRYIDKIMKNFSRYEKIFSPLKIFQKSFPSKKQWNNACSMLKFFLTSWIMGSFLKLITKIWNKYSFFFQHFPIYFHFYFTTATIIFHQLYDIIFRSIQPGRHKFSYHRQRDKLKCIIAYKSMQENCFLNRLIQPLQFSD